MFADGSGSGRMTDNGLTARLAYFAARIGDWQARSKVLKTKTEEALASLQIDESELLFIETSLSDLRAEIAEFDALAAQVSEVSSVAGAELAEAREALRLILLEITELSTAMYSTKSFPVE